jgi:hypothetical protein
LVDSAIELKRLHGPGYPRNNDGELLVLHDGDEIATAENEDDALSDVVDDLFDEQGAENSSDEGEE